MGRTPSSLYHYKLSMRPKYIHFIDKTVHFLGNEWTIDSHLGNIYLLLKTMYQKSQIKSRQLFYASPKGWL